MLYGYLSFDKVQNNPIIFPFSVVIKIKIKPDTTKPVYPVITGGQYRKDR